MSPSIECVQMVKEFEGFASQAYADGAHHSIGYGHHGPEVKTGDQITPEEAEKQLVADLAQVAEAVNRMVKVPVTQQQFDALCSFAYNVGAETLRRSTLMLLLNAGDPPEIVAKQFGRWNRQDNRILAGLTKRREAERVLFLGGA